MLSDKIFKAICALDHQRTKDIFTQTTEAYKKINPNSDPTSRLPTEISRANFRLNFIDFFKNAECSFRKDGLKYTVIHTLLNGDLQDEDIPNLESSLNTAAKQWHSCFDKLHEAVIANSTQKVKALLVFGANAVWLNKFDASPAGLALALKNNDCFNIISSHPDFIYSFTTSYQLWYLLEIAANTNKTADIKPFLPLANETDHPLHPFMTDILTNQDFEKITQPELRQIFIDLGFSVPKINNLETKQEARDEADLFLGNKYNELTFKRIIGRTSSAAVVYHGEWMNEQVAIKTFSNEFSLAFQREKKIHRDLKHPRIISYFSYYTTNQYFLIVMELAYYGSLYDNIVKGNYNDTIAIRWLLHVASALSYLHHKYVHGDVKAQNVFITSPDSAKLGDFGGTFSINDRSSYNIYTTLSYVAPECIEAGEHINATSIDIFAFGLMSHETLCKQPAWYKESFCFFATRPKSLAQTQLSTVASGFRPPQNALSDERYQLMQDCWQNDPAKRPTAEQIIPRLK